MGSRELVALRLHLNELRRDLIVGKSYPSVTRREYRMATAFVILATAALEDYFEKRCRSAAISGVERLRRVQPTRSGHTLVIWWAVNKCEGTIPLTWAEISTQSELLAKIQKNYEKMVEANHGVRGYNLRKLLIPLGIKEDRISSVLLDRLDELAEIRNRASHGMTNRAKLMADPMADWDRINKIFELVEKLDDAINEAANELTT